MSRNGWQDLDTTSKRRPGPFILVPIDYFSYRLSIVTCSRTHRLTTMHSVQTTDGRNTVPIATSLVRSAKNKAWETVNWLKIKVLRCENNSRHNYTVQVLQWRWLLSYQCMWARSTFSYWQSSGADWMLQITTVNNAGKEEWSTGIVQVWYCSKRTSPLLQKFAFIKERQWLWQFRLIIFACCQQ